MSWCKCCRIALHVSVKCYSSYCGSRVGYQLQQQNRLCSTKMSHQVRSCQTGNSRQKRSNCSLNARVFHSCGSMADYQELVEVDFGKDKDLALVRYSLQNLQTADYPAGTGLALYADPYTRAVRASFQIFYRRAKRATLYDGVQRSTARYIYIYGRCPTVVRTKCKLLILQTQALLADYSKNVCHTCPLTFNDSYNPF